jgi:3-oxoacyl-[acyl-carrier protein] reductase
MVYTDRFKGRVAVVTGGADGIGKAIARRLASEGARVALFDVNVELMEKTQSEFAKEGMRVLTVKCDVANEESVKGAIQRVVNAAKRLDIMVNCAGITGPTNVKITEYPTRDFDHVCRVNLHGSFLMAKHSIERMLDRDYGRILLISSMGGKDGNPGMIGYAASKSGVIGLVKALGKEYAETGVRVNGIAPAVIRTGLLDGVAPEQVKYMVDKIPMKRVGTVDEVASLAAWIVSEECSFTTGFVFDLSGGRATY